MSDTKPDRHVHMEDEQKGTPKNVYPTVLSYVVLAYLRGTMEPANAKQKAPRTGDRGKPLFSKPQDEQRCRDPHIDPQRLLFTA